VVETQRFDEGEAERRRCKALRRVQRPVRVSLHDVRVRWRHVEQHVVTAAIAKRRQRAHDVGCDPLVGQRDSHVLIVLLQHHAADIVV
jgi:hypothetical protein